MCRASTGGGEGDVGVGWGASLFAFVLGFLRPSSPTRRGEKKNNKKIGRGATESWTDGEQREDRVKNVMYLCSGQGGGKGGKGRSSKQTNGGQICRAGVGRKTKAKGRQGEWDEIKAVCTNVTRRQSRQDPCVTKPKKQNSTNKKKQNVE